MQIDTALQALEFLKSAGAAGDVEQNLLLCALAFSKVLNPDIEVRQSLAKVEEIANSLRKHAQIKTDTVSDLELEKRQAVLAETIGAEYGYIGALSDYHDPENAEIHKVLERKKGLPVALGIIYIHLAREMDWDARGLNFPGHFLLTLESGERKIFIDPFSAGRAVGAADMREILKALAGQQAELSHDYYRPISDKNILIRLQNNLKSALIDQENYERALAVTDAMRVFDPDEYRLLFDASILKVKAGQFQAARQDALAYIDAAPSAKERMSGEQLLYEIERALN